MIGISETLVSTSLAGILFALVAGQPLVIVGATGPLLLFDESLFAVSILINRQYRHNDVYLKKLSVKYNFQKCNNLIKKMILYFYFQFCEEHGIEFLTMRVWIGVWLLDLLRKSLPL
jgi:hypothetical protein